MAFFADVPKPQTFTARRAASLSNVLLASKTDGERAVVVQNARGLFAGRGAGTFGRISDETSAAQHVFDAEVLANERSWRFVIHDAMVLHGHDVRARPFLERIEAARAACPSDANGSMFEVKDFYPLCEHAQRLDRLVATLMSKQSDGLILMQADSPYDEPPLKFKRDVTVDLRLVVDGQLKYVTDDSNFFQGVCTHIDHECIVECSKKRNGPFSVVKERPDRIYPNRPEVARENAGIVDAGANTLAFLKRNLHVDRERDYRAYFNAARRCALAGLAGFASPALRRTILDVGCGAFSYRSIFRGHAVAAMDRNGLFFISEASDVEMYHQAIESFQLSSHPFDTLTFFFSLHEIEIEKVDLSCVRAIAGLVVSEAAHLPCGHVTPCDEKLQYFGTIGFKPVAQVQPLALALPPSRYQFSSLQDSEAGKIRPFALSR